MKEIITRFPPSPTGYLHLGGARTAIFNWLYARHTKGRFVLRIEDTDTKRSTTESTDAIFEALEWLGIDYDEGPYFQSERYDIYEKYVAQLIDAGHAYYCDCSSERLDEMRKKAMAEGRKPKYDGKCRDKCLASADNTVIRFKAPLSGNTILRDVIKGNIVFQNTELDDFIIRRSDKTFTYNFVVVIDDITMNINTIIRGDDHVNNTPRQILLYQALNCPLPDFGHVPMVLGSDKTRLSKRHGAMSVTAYKEMGYLPEAMINYLVRLGWSFGDQEFFTREDLIEKFSLENVGKSAGVFNPEKLMALNADHIKATEPAKLQDLLLSHIKPRLADKTCSVPLEKGSYLTSAIETLNARSKTLEEMAEAALFYYTDDIEYDPKGVKKIFKQAAIEPLRLLIEKLSAVDEFTEKNLESVFLAVMEETGLKLGKIAQPVRLALTGKTFSPGIFEIIEIIGRQRVVSRLEKAVQYIENK